MRREGYSYAYATRLNGFRADAARAFPDRNRLTALDLAARAATVPGLSAVDFNFPDHLEGLEAADLRPRLGELGLELNGFAMRYAGDPAFRSGALGHADPAVRARAVDLTRRGIDALRAAGGTLMTIWPGQDGFEHAFGLDHAASWDAMAESLAAVCAHDPGVDVALEYKPDEPRARALLPDAATTLLLLSEVGAPNAGVTLDFAHVLYAGETPARAAALIARRSRILGIHLNDAYGRRDDGLTTASVHPILTLELLWALERLGYAGPLYFDTFPDAAGLDPVEECAANIAAVEGLARVLARLPREALDAAAAGGDALGAMRIVQAALYP